MHTKEHTYSHTLKHSKCPAKCAAWSKFSPSLLIRVPFSALKRPSNPSIISHKNFKPSQSSDLPQKAQRQKLSSFLVPKILSLGLLLFVYSATFFFHSSFWHFPRLTKTTNRPSQIFYSPAVCFERRKAATPANLDDYWLDDYASFRFPTSNFDEKF